MSRLEVTGQHGQLVLRSRAGHHEIISNGVLLMDTRDDRSERLLVRAALDTAARADHLLIGGLGVGFSLAEAIGSGAPHVTVVECEPEIIEWNRTTTGRFTGGSVAHPSVTCIEADLVTWLRDTRDRFDVICLDIDNGPEWTVSAANAGLYSADGLRRVGRRLRDGGVLSIWSADRSPDLERALGELFEVVQVLQVPVRRGPPDVVYVASGLPELRTFSRTREEPPSW